MGKFWGGVANLAAAIGHAFLVPAKRKKISKYTEKLDLTGYHLTLEDHFEGNELNTDIWSSHGEGVRRGGYWDINQCTVKDSNLIITTEYKTDGKFGPGWYTAGLQSAGKFEQAFGYFECRCILPKGHGLWSAFWMMNAEVHHVFGNGRQGTEIDIYESPFYHLGKKGYIVTSNLHYNGYGIETRMTNICICELDNNPYENYNTYGLLWTPDEYQIYINGIKVGSSSFGGVSQNPEYMLLSCEVDGISAVPQFGWSGHLKNNPAGFKGEFIVDYVKVYSKD
ncbi:MAG TPA: glycoside hydrolase family 16 protein [Clostridiales bacterium]|nr:glycoside hydrolase family 16 protein [Clostridiales bacterium]